MLVYSPRYNMDLRKFGFNKPFALDRGQLVLDALALETSKSISYTEPEPITVQDAELVHTKEYLDSLQNDDVWREIFELKDEELIHGVEAKPLHLMLDDILLKSGGTLLASRSALSSLLSCNLGGGYHHAFPEQGRGFCVINDIAVTIRKMQKQDFLKRIMIVDLDFHQGDGNALIFRDDPDVFTLSVHSQEGWPDEKQESDLDVPIYSDETELYLEKTSAALEEALARFSPQLCIFVAGSDPYELDVLPGTRFLKLSLERMRQRDELVIDTFFERGIPLSMVFAGGYGPDVWKVHHQAVRHMLVRLGTITDTIDRTTETIS